MIPSQAAVAGTMCGLFITYGPGAYIGQNFNWDSLQVGFCNGNQIAYAKVEYVPNPGGWVCGSSSADTCSNAYYVNPGYDAIYKTAANCPSGYAYRVIAASDESQSGTCFAS